MTKVWSGLKLSLTISLILGLSFSCAFFGILLYARITGHDAPALLAKSAETEAARTEAAAEPGARDSDAADRKAERPLPKSAMLDAPVIRQFPELPAGCEITSLAMLLQFAGFHKDKLELAGEMPLDPTPIRWSDGGEIAYWGNPNRGFVGDVTRERIGFGIYHAGLFPLLKHYVAGALDLSGSDFTRIERQVADGVPVVVWTTTNFRKPDRWVKWDSPSGPVKATFSEHAVLLVGYDAQYVYVNDPISGRKNVKIGRSQFVETWEALGKQALSYSPEPY